MKKQSYSDKLKSPKWQKKRLNILNRDNFTCQLCGDTETELHVNHLKYTGEPYDAPNEDLETLCKHCHLIHHSVKEKISNVIKIVYDDYVDVVYTNELGSCCGTIHNDIFHKHCGFLFNSKSLQHLYNLNKRHIEVEFQQGFDFDMFLGYENFKKLVMNEITNVLIGETFFIDRPTHSCAMEQFEFIDIINGIIHIKHIGGVS